VVVRAGLSSAKYLQRPASFFIYTSLSAEKNKNLHAIRHTFLYSMLNIFFAASSGDSTNPARSFGPAVITGNFSHYWLYWVAPVVGVILITGLFK